MQRSKLELYEEILYALVNKHLTVDAIAYTCNMDCVALNQRLAFLAKSGLIQEGTCKNKLTYALTRRGAAVSKTLTVTKRLEKLHVSAETPG